MSLFKKSTNENKKTKPKLTKEEKIELHEKNKKEMKEKVETDKKIRELVATWISIMAHTGNDNQMDETFTLRDIKKEPYGFNCMIHIASSLTFATLENQSMINIIEDNIGCLFVTKRIPKSKCLKAQFITEDIPEIDFEPIKDTKPYELYMGTSIDGGEIICSMIKYPHLIVQGATNMGKTKMIDSIVTNLITQCTPDELSLFFIQADKSDQIIYRKCKHTRAYADTLEKAFAVTNYLKEIVNHRDKTLRPLIEDGICDNIMGYNQIRGEYISSDTFSYIYMIIDEYSSLMPSDSDTNYNKKIKMAIQNNIERLIQVGRYVGVYLIIGLQRSTVDKLPSFIKAMCNTIATFRVNNEKSSYVAIDSNEAVNLNPRESIIKTNDKIMAKTVTITAPMIVNYIAPFRVKSGEYKDFPYESFMNLNKLFENDKKSSKKKNNNKKKEDYCSVEGDISNNKPTLNQDTKTIISEKDLSKFEKNIATKQLKKEIPVQETIKNNKEAKDTLKPIESKLKIPQKDILIPKTKNPYLIENWDELSKNITVIDKTKIDLSKTEKPKRREDK